VHLDQVRDGRANEDYQNPVRFFERTFLTKNLFEWFLNIAHFIRLRRKFSGGGVQL